MKNNITYSLIVSQIIFLVLLPLWMQLTKYLHPLVIGVVWFCYSFLALFIICWVLKKGIKISLHTLHSVIFIYSTALLVLLFFRPNNQSYGSVNLIPFETIRLYLSGNANLIISFYNLAGNIGLFIPFGLYYRHSKKEPAFIQILLITIGSISIIEGLQFFTHRGSLDVDDLILNVLGVTIGYTIYPVFHKVIMLKKRK